MGRKQNEVVRYKLSILPTPPAANDRRARLKAFKNIERISDTSRAYS